MNEEEAFWILIMLIETILPLDYYSNMVGVLIDQQVFKAAIRFFFPDLYEHFNTLNFDPSLLAFQWLVCFFTLNINETVSLKIWDLFMIKGFKALFCTALAMIDHLREQLLRVSDLGMIFMMFDEAQKHDEVMTTVFLRKIGLYYQSISNNYVSKMRQYLRPEVELDLQQNLLQRDLAASS
jgi:hypothetical protein